MSVPEKPIKIGRLPVSARNALRKKDRRESKKITTRMFAGCDSIPDKIIIYFNQKIDFSKIDNAIKFKYKKLKETIPDLEKKIKIYKTEIETTKDRSRTIYNHKEIDRLEKLIDDYNTDKSISRYIELTENILSELGTEQEEHKIDEYFSIARKYINIDVIKNVKEESRCRGCGEIIEDDGNSDSILVCQNCDCVNTIMRLSRYTRDIEYGGTVYDEDIINFIKVLDKFEGKNTTPIHEGLYTELDDYMENINVKTGEYFRSLPLNDQGKKAGTSKKLLWQALERLGYNQYYDEASYICHVYWGWDLPDLSLYRDKLIEDYQNTQTVWKKIKSEYSRSASLGTQYRLYKQLLAVGYPNCYREDFRVQEMVDSLRLHDHAWKRMCEETGVKFFPTSG